MLASVSPLTWARSRPLIAFQPAAEVQRQMRFVALIMIINDHLGIWTIDLELANEARTPPHNQLN